MPFTKTDFRQFFDEIQMIRKRKEFSGTFTESFKWFGLCKADTALDIKRKEYDHLYTNVFRKYGIVPDDLYSDLDRIWSDALQCDCAMWIKIYRAAKGKVFNQNLSIIWDLYMNGTIEHARGVGDRNQ